MTHHNHGYLPDEHHQNEPNPPMNCRYHQHQYHLGHHHQHETVITRGRDSWHRDEGSTDSHGYPVWDLRSNLGACLAPFGFLLFGAGITLLVVVDGNGSAAGILIAVLGVVLFFAGLLAASSCIKRWEGNIVSQIYFLSYS